MTWGKIDNRMQCSPRLRRIGKEHGRTRAKDATLVWGAILAVNSEHDCAGKIDALYADRDYLGGYCPHVTSAELECAVEDLVDAGMVELVEGAMVLPGWDHTWRAVMPSTARVKLHRELKRAKQEAKLAKGRGPRIEERGQDGVA